MIILIIIIGLSALIFVHELGHFLAAKFFGVKVEEFGIGFPPRLFKKKIGDTVYSINLLPFGGFVKIFGEDDGVPGNSENFSNKPVWKRSAIILAGVFMNVIFGWLVYTAVFMQGAPAHLMIADVAFKSPAAEAGIKSGDVVLEIKHENEIFQDPIQSKNFIDIVNRNLGDSLDIRIQRDKEFLEMKLTGREVPPAGQGPIGVSLVEIGFKSESFPRSLFNGFVITVSNFKLLVVGFVQFFAKLFVAPRVLETVAGPVGIFSLAAQAGSLGLVYLFQLIAFISVNLAVLNLIPFPALDGGRFVLILIEKIKGSPISRKIQTTINAFGFLLIIAIMVIVTIQDIGKLIH